MMVGRYAHAKQFKRHPRQLRLLRTRLGRLIRDIGRKIEGRPELEAMFEAPLARARQIRTPSPVVFGFFGRIVPSDAATESRLAIHGNQK